MQKTIFKNLFLLSVLSIVAVGVEAQHGQNGFIDKANMISSIKPGDDFYNYASGNWIKNNPVPAKETRWGSFNVLRDFNINAVKNILEKAATDKNAPAGSITRRVGDFYAAGMDSIAIEKAGYTPIKSDLSRIAAIKDLTGVIKEMNYLRSHGIASPLYGFYIGGRIERMSKK
ncbi:M13 family metallopeptidase [Niabella ginsengisoli]|uniref:M13 family metallopeptidase n=1 Tax=Niabella ginsengisoli TaxID=522298 RepID=A0ABS9SPB1_9BACT|nr:M13 family metallopeptidase [Niabella ginsengisoli]MCH5600238.1 M13 family metallopeptidase [Niabella ginsengisoli]